IDTRPDGKSDDCGGRLIVGGGAAPFEQAALHELPDGLPDLFVYNPFFNAIYRVGNDGASDYTAYTLELVRRLHRNWQLEASYVWSSAAGDRGRSVSSLDDDPASAA